MSVVHRLLRKPFFGRFEVTWQWPEQARPDQWARVEVPTVGRHVLRALYGTAATPEPRGMLVMAHPMGKAAKGFWLRYGHATLLRDAGFHVLLVDANGFGESAPRSFDYPLDFHAAGLVAQSLAPELRLGLFGASFGAGWGLCAMSHPDTPYRAAVLEGVFPTLPEFWRHYPVAHAALRASQLVMPSIERRMRPEAHAAQLHGLPDVLLLYGANDIFTPPAHGERLLRAMRDSARAELNVFPGVEHTFAYRDATDAYVASVFGFLDRVFPPDSASSEPR
ncbi:MAG: prolyl oligopeptidase family serine peptidase [Gemmatimonadaceae bacterium]|nr:prolyl oligopeptidase family serine peptidase [Gemmatimonadaceae bacterium]